MFKNVVIAFIVLFCLWVIPTANCEEAKKEPSTELVKKINNIIIDTEKKEIRIKCSLSILQGILEFFLVDEVGRTYESVFMVSGNKPSELQFGLLLLGFKPVPFDEYMKLLKEKDGLDVLKKKNCLLDLEISQKNIIVPLTSIIANRENKEQKYIWAFTGGAFDEKNRFVPDLESIFISIWPMLSSVINLCSTSGNPYRGEVGYEIAKDIPFTMEDDFILIIRGAK